MTRSANQRQRRLGALEEGAWGRNLAKVSLPLVRLTHLITLPNAGATPKYEPACQLGRVGKMDTQRQQPARLRGSRTLQLMQAQRGGSKLCSRLSSMPRGPRSALRTKTERADIVKLKTTGGPLLPASPCRRKRYGMAELSRLSESARRLHALRWKDLIKRHGFTGGNLKWHESRVRRHEAAKPAFSLKPPPPEPLRHSGPSVTFFGSQGEPLTYEEWHRREVAAWAARENDPAVIDSIAIAETLALARARFVDIVGDYLSVWADTSGDSGEFTRWLEGIGVLVGREVGDLWKNGEWHVAWFERACRKKVEECLAPLIEEWKSRASGLEILHLENPHLSLRSLLVAGGDLKLAFTFEQGEQAIDSAQRALDSLRSADSATFSGDRPVQATEPATVTSVAGQLPPAAADRSSGSQTADRPEPSAPRDAARSDTAMNASASASATAAPKGSAQDANTGAHLLRARKPSMHRQTYSKIDDRLTAISAAKPKDHEGVFRLLDGVVRIPYAEPFQSSGGWMAGFQKHPKAARVWLSKRWGLLNLPAFPRGPKSLQ